MQICFFHVNFILFMCLQSLPSLIIIMVPKKKSIDYFSDRLNQKIEQRDRSDYIPYLRITGNSTRNIFGIWLDSGEYDVERGGNSGNLYGIGYEGSSGSDISRDEPSSDRLDDGSAAEVNPRSGARGNFNIQMIEHEIDLSDHGTSSDSPYAHSESESPTDQLPFPDYGTGDSVETIFTRTNGGYDEGYRCGVADNVASWRWIIDFYAYLKDNDSVRSEQTDIILSVLESYLSSNNIAVKRIDDPHPIFDPSIMEAVDTVPAPVPELVGHVSEMDIPYYSEISARGVGRIPLSKLRVVLYGGFPDNRGDVQ